MSLPSSRYIENLIASLRDLPTQSGMASRQRPTQSIEDLLNKGFFQKKNYGAQYLPTLLAKNWTHLLGEFLASRTQADALLPNGKLIIKCQSAAIRTELSFQEKAILTKIQALPAASRVKGLIIQL